MNKIKITLNGIKVNDNYIPCHFSIDNLSNCVWVYARNYGRGTLPEELGTVTNDTDSREDYFETDHVAVTPLNKYFTACKKSAIYSRIKDMKSKIKYCEKQIAIYDSGYYQEMYQKEGYNPTYRLPGGPIMPCIAIFMTCTLIWGELTYAPIPSLICAALAIGTGLPVYYFWEKKNKQQAA